MFKKIRRWWAETYGVLSNVYCKECGSCGEVGCCSPLGCAYNNMVKKSKGLYCWTNYKELEFTYKLAMELYKGTPEQEKIWDKIYKEVHEKENKNEK